MHAPRQSVFGKARGSRPSPGVDGPFGVMFHHFRDAGRHPAGQGAISADQLVSILDLLEDRHVLSAHEWLWRAERGRLRAQDRCLTFDDNLRCQFDVAGPVLAERGLTAFWFVSTRVLDGDIIPLEAYRYFRSTRFPDADSFYAAFDVMLAAEPDAAALDAAARAQPADYLREFPFYSDADRRFRFVRDRVLGAVRYDAIMQRMIELGGASLAELARGLWMGAAELRALHEAGHVIGLHSHTHPTQMARLSRAQQAHEYSQNHARLQHLLGVPPVAMAHPCNSYNADTLDVLRALSVRVGFRANAELASYSALELPRLDHVLLLSEDRACA